MKKLMIKIGSDVRGIAVLVSVILIAAVILVISLSLGFAAVTENEMTLYQTQANKLFVNTDACAEEALARINRDHSYTGETLTIDDADCTISISGNGANRSITISAVKDNFSRNLQINVKIVPSFEITSWSEVIN